MDCFVEDPEDEELRALPLPPRGTNHSNMCCVIHTLGSPKGSKSAITTSCTCAQRHGGLLALWARRCLDPLPLRGLRLLCVGNVRSAVLWREAGHCAVLCCAITARLPLLIKEKVTFVNQTPSAWNQLTPHLIEGGTVGAIRFVTLGGEKLEFHALVDYFATFGFDKPRLVNMCGITETHQGNHAGPYEVVALQQHWEAHRRLHRAHSQRRAAAVPCWGGGSSCTGKKTR